MAKIPAVMTASPYHQGTNDKASDKALYKMEAELEVKEPHEISLEKPTLDLVEPVGEAELVPEAEERLTHINSSYTLNDYFLPKRICQYPTYQVLVPKIHKVKWPTEITDKLKPIKMSLIGSMAAVVLLLTIVVSAK